MTSTARRRPSPPARLLRLESLEDRAVPAAGHAVPAGALYNPSQVLARLQPGTDPAALGLPGLTVGNALPLVPGLYEVRLSDGVSVDAAVAALRGSSLVALAQPDYVVHTAATPDDPGYGSEWGLAAVSAPAAWNVSTGTGRVTVAVIDSGVDYAHPDLAPNAWLNQGEIPAQWYAGAGLATVVRRADLVDADGDGKISFRDLNAPANAGKVTDLNGNGYVDGRDLLAPLSQGGWADGADADANGYKDDLLGWNFVANSNDPMDDLGHGTHVAGTIGAVGNNGAGVAGVVWNVRLMALKFIDASGSGYTSAAVQALNYAVRMGAQVSNNSWGGGGYDSTLATAIQNARAAGHIFVAAAGNSTADNDAAAFYPASYPSDNVVAVAATDGGDNLGWYSNYGAASVDLAAPGSDIYSTLPGGGYGSKTGTSMAAPHVAGALALVWDAHPDWSYSQVIAQVLGTVDPVAALAGRVATGGRLDLAAALGTAVPYTPPSQPVVSPPPASPPPPPASPPPPPASPPPAAVAADRYEPNNTAATATDLGKGNNFGQTKLTLHTAADQDYYKFTLIKAGTYVVTVTPTGGAGTLSASVLSAGLAPVTSAQSASGAVTLSVSLQAGIAYYLKVASPTGSLLKYDLDVAVPKGKGGKGGAAEAGAALGDVPGSLGGVWLAPEAIPPEAPAPAPEPAAPAAKAAPQPASPSAPAATPVAIATTASGAAAGKPTTPAAKPDPLAVK